MQTLLSLLHAKGFRIFTKILMTSYFSNEEGEASIGGETEREHSRFSRTQQSCASQWCVCMCVKVAANACSILSLPADKLVKKVDNLEKNARVYRGEHGINLKQCC